MKFIFLLLICFSTSEINFSHLPKHDLQFSKNEIAKLRTSGTFNNINDAVYLISESLPEDLIRIFLNSKKCIESNPIKESDIYSYTTIYGAYNDLINFCSSVEFNKLNKSNIDSEQMFYKLIDWSNSLSTHVFDINRDSQPLLDQYIDIMACDNKINYHLLISAVLIKIKLKDFDSSKFLNYLFYNDLDDEEMCKDYRDFWNKRK